MSKVTTLLEKIRRATTRREQSAAIDLAQAVLAQPDHIAMHEFQTKLERLAVAKAKASSPVAMAHPTAGGMKVPISPNSFTGRMIAKMHTPEGQKAQLEAANSILARANQKKSEVVNGVRIDPPNQEAIAWAKALIARHEKALASKQLAQAKPSTPAPKAQAPKAPANVLQAYLAMPSGPLKRAYLAKHAVQIQQLAKLDQKTS
jgi:hypothetical protein